MIRSPFGYKGESSSRKKSSDETPDESEILDQAYIVIERYNQVKEDFHKLHSFKYNFMVLIGQENIQPFLEIDRVINKIFVSARMLGTHYWKRQGHVKMSDEKFEKHLKGLEKYEAIFWQMSENDEISKRVNNAIKDIEDICIKVLKPK